MKDISDGNFEIALEPKSRNICKLKLERISASDYDNEALPSLGLDSGNLEEGWDLSGSAGDFLISRKEEKVAKFFGLVGEKPDWAGKDENEASGWTGLKHEVEKDSLVFGLGEKTKYLEKSGATFEMWNRDANGFYTHNEDPLYASIPFYIVVGPEPEDFIGVYLHNTERSKFSVKSRAGRENIGLAVAAPKATIYLVTGDNLKEVIGSYTELTGKPYFPPKWAIGYHHSNYGRPGDQEEAIDLAREFREKDIPCDALYFDIQHMDGRKDFTWDEEKFPEPEAMLEALKEMNYRTVAIVDPGIKEEEGYPVFDSGRENDVFVRDRDGEDFSGSVWPGFCRFPDFLREDVRSWWAGQNEKLLREGIDGIWNDMNEPAIFFGKRQLKDLATEIEEKVTDGKHLDYQFKHRLMTVGEDNSDSLLHRNDEGREVSHEKVHNTYALYEAMATTKAFENVESEERPFILTRAGFPGIQKYAAKWTGDNSSTWEHMKLSVYMTLNLGMSGLPFVGPDIGGFDGDVEAELLTRWIQLGAVTPFCRNHSGLDTIPQEPWSFGEEYEAINRRFIELRYQLLPFLYTEFFRTSRTGLPILRPLFLEFPGDEETYSVSDQFMVGESLLVAPIFERNAERRLLYLPREETGRTISWLDWWSGERLSSGYHVVDAPLDVMPLFLREGTGVPFTEPVLHTEESPNTLKLRVNTGESGDTSVEVPVYHDDGRTRDFERGNYFYGKFRFAGDEAGLELETENDGYPVFWENVEIA